MWEGRCDIYKMSNGMLVKGNKEVKNVWERHFQYVMKSEKTADC